MRRAVVVSTLMCFSSVVHAQLRDSVITINASRTTRVIPDRASAYVMIEGTAETTADALARVETKIKAVTDALRALPSRPEVDRPVSSTVPPAAREQGYPSPSNSVQFTARAAIRVQSRVDQIATIASAALAAGGLQLSGLTFESSVADSVRRVKIGEAVASARVDAEALAAALGGRLGALV